jgi:hypothetical protein
MASGSPTAEDNRRGRRPRARRRLGIGAAGVAVGGAGGGYLVTARLADLGKLVHLLPVDALFLLIVTVGVVVAILGWRAIVYLERRDQHRHEIISGMWDREAVHQEYQDGSSKYVSWPMTAAAPRGQSPPPRRSLPRPGKTGNGDVVSLDRHQQVIPAPRPEDGVADPGPASWTSPAVDGPG